MFGSNRRRLTSSAGLPMSILGRSTAQSDDDDDDDDFDVLILMYLFWGSVIVLLYFTAFVAPLCGTLLFLLMQLCLSCPCPCRVGFC